MLGAVSAVFGLVVIIALVGHAESWGGLGRREVILKLDREVLRLRMKLSGVVGRVMWRLKMGMQLG